MDSSSYSFYQFPHSLYKSSTPPFLFRLEGVSEVYLLATSIASGMHRKWVKKGMLSKVNLRLSSLWYKKVLSSNTVPSSLDVR